MKKKSRMKFDPYLFDKSVIGALDVYSKHIPWANGFVYIRLQIARGARFDPVGKEGLAHFFEHLPFDGCEGWPIFDDIEKISRTLFFDTLGASTYMERTVFEAKVSSKRLDEALDFFSSFVFKPTMDKQEIERERKVITQEIWRRYNNEKEERLARTLRKLEYGDHAFGRINSPAGWHDTVALISESDLKDFHHTHYHKGNTSLILAGDIDIEAVRSILQSFAKRLPDGPTSEQSTPVESWPHPMSSEFTVSASDYFGLTGHSVPQVTKMEVLRLLPVLDNDFELFILGQVIRQLLFERIRGKLGATYSPRVTSGVFVDHRSLEISLGIAPESEAQVREVISTTLSDVRAGKTDLIPLFEETKSVFLERKLYYDPSVCDIADDAASDLATKGRIESAEEECAAIERISFDDIVRLASTHLAPEALLWEIVRP